MPGEVRVGATFVGPDVADMFGPQIALDGNVQAVRLVDAIPAFGTRAALAHHHLVSRITEVIGCRSRAS